LKIHSWMVSSEVLGGCHKRIKTCRACWPQNSFFPIRTHPEDPLILGGPSSLVLAKWLPESKSVLLDLPGLKPTDDKVFSLRHTLALTHGWFPWSLIFTGLRQLVTTTESKSWTMQSRMLRPPATSFSLRKHLDIHSGTDPWRSIPRSCWPKWLAQQNQNLFLFDWAGSKPGDNKFIFLSGHTFTLIHEWFLHRLFSTRLSQVVTTTESKSVSLGLYRFETCRTTRFFFSEHTLTFTYEWFHWRFL
jgi:hypothetical protein